MTYLICELCGGYYYLEEDESIYDFDSCQCGGKFILVEMDDDAELFEAQNSQFEMQTPETLDVETQPAENICNECGNPNDSNTAFCSKCGQILVPARELSGIEDTSDKKPKIRIFAGFTIIALSLVLLGFLF